MPFGDNITDLSLGSNDHTLQVPPKAALLSPVSLDSPMSFAPSYRVSLGN